MIVIDGSQGSEVTVMRRFLCVISLLAVSAILWAGCENSSSPSSQPAKHDSQPFKIGMVTFAGYAPLYLAKEKGFFGTLDVQLNRIEDVAAIRAAIEAGGLDAYLATPDIAQDTNTRPPGKAVFAIDESNGGDGVVVGPGIDDLTALRGKRVAAEPGLPPNFVLLYLLHKNEMALNDVSFQDMTTQNAATAFAAGAVDAAGLYEPFLSTARSQRSGSKIVISSNDTPGMIVDLIFVSDATFAGRRSDITMVISGWEKAVAYSVEHPEESVAIMARAFGLSSTEFKEIAEGVTWLTISDNWRLFGTPSNPGPLYDKFDEVNSVLRRNRAGVFKSASKDYLLRDFLAGS